MSSIFVKNVLNLVWQVHSTSSSQYGQNHPYVLQLMFLNHPFKRQADEKTSVYNQFDAKAAKLIKMIESQF
jgi:hypothetical protein